MTTKWPRVSLGELLRLERRPVRVRDDAEYQEIGIYCLGRGIFHKTPRSGLEVGDKNLFLLKEGDFILQVTFAWEGAVAIVSAADDGMYGSTRYPAFRVDESRCVPEFLLHYFKTKGGLQQLTKISPGSAGRNRVLSIKRIPEVFVPLPPLPEQRRAVSRIEELAAQIHEARALRHQAQMESTGLLFGSCESMLRHTEKLFPIEPLQALVDQARGISYGIVQTGSDAEGGIPTLRAGDLRWFSVNTVNVKRVTREIAASYRRTILKGGELLLRIRGGVGEVGICPPQMIGGNVSREIAVIPLQKNVKPHFAMYLLAAPSNQARMVGHVKGTSYTGINLKDVRTLPLPVPPLPEQRRIVEELDALQAEVNALKRLQTETALELDALLPSILDKAFRGEL
jgi:type I restriction enzyme S subunit